jgi:ribosomal protein S18 acetylase RimI-like enzyme
MFSSRPYAGDADRERLRTFLAAANAEDARGGGRTFWHVGDLLWALYQNTELDPASTIRLWEDERGEVAGFGWFDEPDTVEWQIAPRWRGGDLASEMLAWGERRAREAGASVLRRKALDGDTETLALLAANGFARDDRTPLALQQRRGFPPEGYYYVGLARDLHQTIPEPDWEQAAAGGGTSGVRPYETRAVGGEDEWPARVELHRAVWQPSRVTLEAYRRLRGVPGYRPELDLVAAAPNGDFAAYCICWLDAENRTGEFEPVGTAPAYRRQGAGRAVMLEGLRRLREAGAETAIVYSVANNPPAVALYESVGFRVYDEEHYYEKPLSTAG